MTLCWRFFIFAFSTWIAAQSIPGTNAVDVIQGSWIIKKDFLTYNGSAIDQAGVEHFFGKTVVYRPDSISVDGETYRVTYTTGTDSEEKFSRSFLTTARELGFAPGAILHVDAARVSDGGMDFPCALTFIIRQDELACDYRGVLFELDRPGVSGKSRPESGKVFSSGK